MSRRAAISAGVAALIALSLSSPPTTSATSTDIDAPTSRPSAEIGWVTLPTGDRVTYERDARGIEVLGVKAAPGASGRFRTVVLGDHVRVIPFEAQRYVDSGQIDPAIFDVADLADATDPSLEVSRESGDRRRLPIRHGAAQAHDQWVSLVGARPSDAAAMRPTRAPGIAAIGLDTGASYSGGGQETADATDATDPCAGYSDPNEPGPGKFPVTIKALDRRGDPSWGNFVLHDYHCRPWENNGYIQFAAPPETGKTFYLAPSTFSLMGDITTLDASGRFLQEVTIGGNPQFDVDGAREIVVDARDAERLETSTRHESEPATAVLGWTRGIPGSRLVTAVVLTPQYDSVTTLSAIPSPPITDGEFDFYPTFRETASIVSADLHRHPSLHPKLLPGSSSEDMDADLRLTDLEHPCHRCAVVVQEDADTGLAGPVEAARSRGAAAVVVVPAEPGVVYGSVDSPDVPVLAVPYAEGRSLLHHVDRRSKMEVTVTPHSPYLYDLALRESRSIPDDLSYRIGDNDVHRVVQRFHGDGVDSAFYETRSPISPCRCSLQPIFHPIEKGSERVDYVSDNGSVWQQQLFKPGFTVRDAAHAYTHGDARTTDWLEAPLTPGLAYANDVPITDFRYPALSQNGSLTVRIPPVTDHAGHGGSGGFTEGRLFRNGELVQELDGYTTVPEGTTPATWRLEIDHSHFSGAWASATVSQVAWTFTAGGPPSSEPVPLPLIDASIDVPVDLSGTPRGPRIFTVTPWRLDGAPTHRVDVTMAFSTDGGLTWKSRAYSSRSRRVLRPSKAGWTRPGLHAPTSRRLRWHRR